MSVETAHGDDRPTRLTSLGILETSLYVDAMDRARRFYEEVLGLATMLASERLAA
jgi:predicted enzyme related to lactoylglutathione lyase